ncbi:MarR family winged helix-turn-helix transcriptional regulator [Agromyces agglutinans]|uniref:MarR family winged helix-turn-helix transcriptional regulator n=1 Tax=Agromyces agglutinans TaxID=2662258 RepID=UPI001561D964|nr:MarR family transcriptional regulator [Agromyces agglutinans]
MTRKLDSAGAARLSGVVPPLRRGLLQIARASRRLPELPDAQIEVLRLLPAGVMRTPGELADVLRLSRPTISNLLRLMEEQGLVSRRVSDRNRRHIEVRSTDHALALLAQFDAASTEILASALAELAPSELEAIAGAVPALEQLRDHVVARARALPPVETDTSH